MMRSGIVRIPEHHNTGRLTPLRISDYNLVVIPFQVRNFNLQSYFNMTEGGTYEEENGYRSGRNEGLSNL